MFRWWLVDALLTGVCEPPIYLHPQSEVPAHIHARVNATLRNEGSLSEESSVVIKKQERD